MYIADSHVHSLFSGDCQEKLENIFEHAIKNNIQEVTITDHIDPDFPSGSTDFHFDLDEYIRTIAGFRSKLQGKLKINTGVEFGLQPHLIEDFSRIAENKNLDFIIGSTHCARGKDPLKDNFFLGLTKDEAHKIYFEETLKNAKIFKEISVYGHLDFIKRYGRNVHEDFHTINYKKHWELIEEILRTLIASNSGLEINTSAYRYGTSEPYPNDLILKRYRELGGDIITLGSDSHIASHLTKDFHRAYQLLKDCGFNYYTIFNRRKPKFIKLDI